MMDNEHDDQHDEADYMKLVIALCEAMPIMRLLREQQMRQQIDEVFGE